MLLDLIFDVLLSLIQSDPSPLALLQDSETQRRRLRQTRRTWLTMYDDGISLLLQLKVPSAIRCLGHRKKKM
jgi:hypothetical protein